MDCKNGHTDPERYPNGTCKPCAVHRAAVFRKNNPEKTRTRENRRAKEKRQEDRSAALAAYGGKCACCGEYREPFLVIDHVNGDGAEHRRQILKQKAKPPGGFTTYRWLRLNGYPEGFQVLCANCNTAKERGVCPHQMEEHK